jgi:hypothetical protein
VADCGREVHAAPLVVLKRQAAPFLVPTAQEIQCPAP